MASGIHHEDDRFELFANDARMNNTFGVLGFDGTQKYYALDGQHRLAAIKSLIDPDDPASDSPRKGSRMKRSPSWSSCRRGG